MSGGVDHPQIAELSAIERRRNADEFRPYAGDGVTVSVYMGATERDGFTAAPGPEDVSRFVRPISPTSTRAMRADVSPSALPRRPT
jgi:hypothetical protein